jgi:cation diffusion facilitator CzcD-associated flavoprotein CzcO
VDPEERQATYERLWAEEGGFKFVYGSYYDIIFNQAANDTAAEFIRSKIRQIVKDPVVAEKLCPHDHPYGSKRPPIDTGYYETFNRDNVTLVDLRDSPIEEIIESGIRTTACTHAVDVIVFATGFDAMTGSLLRMDIRGRNAAALAEAWSAGPKTYLGLAVAGFPNMFIITGPGSPSVLANMPTAIEQHVEWVGNCIAFVLEGERFAVIEATESAQDDWVEQVRQVADRTLFPRANSWYVGANIPGKERVFMPYVGGFCNYRQQCDDVATNGYEGFRLSAPLTAG